MNTNTLFIKKFIRSAVRRFRGHRAAPADMAAAEPTIAAAAAGPASVDAGLDAAIARAYASNPTAYAAEQSELDAALDVVIDAKPDALAAALAVVRAAARAANPTAYGAEPTDLFRKWDNIFLSDEVFVAATESIFGEPEIDSTDIIFKSEWTYISTTPPFPDRSDEGMEDMPNKRAKIWLQRAPFNWDFKVSPGSWNSYYENERLY
ncbi:hypothetical protein EV175_006206 [Coemansia sp. RSA 1933]|nr:hypothetical protein EV175_006206 [Coemansia sp. RSA 1933]